MCEEEIEGDKQAVDPGVCDVLHDLNNAENLIQGESATEARWKICAF